MMSIQDPGKKPTIQLRASQFVKKLGAFGGLRLPNNASKPSRRSRSTSMDVPRKPFTSPSQPALVSHRIQDVYNDRSSNESILTNRANDSDHKRVTSMSLWNQPAAKKRPLSSPPLSPQRPPGIVVTRHLSNSPSEIASNQITKGSASLGLESPAALRMYQQRASLSSAMRSNSASDSAITSSAWRFPGPKEIPPPLNASLLSSKPLPSLPHSPSQARPDPAFEHGLNSHYSHSNSDTTPNNNDTAEADPSLNIVSPAPDRTPVLLPWTPASSHFDLGSIPSGVISPMALGSPMGTPSRTPSAPSLLSPVEPSRRPTLPLLTDLPPPSFSSIPQSPLNRREIFDKEGHSLRLSPAIIQRAPPWPIKNLPSVSITVGASSNTMPAAIPRIAALQQDSLSSGRRRPSPGSLSAIPALPRSGSVRPQVRENDNPGNHSVGPSASGDPPELDLVQDMDEDEVEEMDQDQGQGDYFFRGPSTSTDRRPSVDSVDETGTDHKPINRLGDVDQTPFNVNTMGWDTDTDTQSFVTARTHLTTRGDAGYFGFKPQSSASHTPRSSDFAPATPRATKGAESGRSPPLHEGKKTIGHHVSHSMSDIHTTLPPDSPSRVEVSVGMSTSTERDQKRKSIARRQSMPSLNALPPAYAPREGEEGGEQLPEYSNSIFMIAQMPRKMEFSQPGVPSRDRKWRRVWCVLEGTKFSVYRIKGVKSVWEGVVGAGDGTVRTSNEKGKEKAKEKAAQEEEEEGRVRKVKEETRRVSFSMQPSPSPTTSSFLSPRRPSSPPASRPSSSGNMSGRNGMEELTPFRSSQIIPLRARTSRPGSSSSLASKSESDRPDPSLLIREYTLQNAESGLGSDYTKRQHVIRVRMEGEQFLLQAKDMEDVVEWIEGFQAAGDVALDLDERKMPRGPMFPRRRRRRRRRPSIDGRYLGLEPAPETPAATDT